jgi:hypothetical protein
MYEPILPIWPEAQIEAQVLAHRRFTQKRFGQSPEVIWLPERVWEPTLAGPFARLGIRGVPVDDSELREAGVSGTDLLKAWSCGSEAQPLRLFPISESLRYRIPFSPLEETLAELKAAAVGFERAVVVYGDDGEKFGSWPRTHAHVYAGGWLRRFLETMLATPWLKLSHFSELLDEPATRIELPAGTYPEMVEWARLAGAGRTVPSGQNPWRNFLAKYSEAGRLHRVVQDFAALGAPSDHILRAQCNCAYWHGVFGGVYLPHLRSALYEELARSRQESSDGLIQVTSGVAGHYLSTPDLDLCVEEKGGALTVILPHDPPFNWACTLMRRKEAYHNELLHGESKTSQGPGSVHSAKGKGGNHWSKRLTYDPYERTSLVDHFLSGRVTVSHFAAGTLGERATFVRGPYHGSATNGQISLAATGSIDRDETAGSVTKTLRASGDGAFLVSYDVSQAAFPRGRFGVEWNLTALASAGPDRWLEINGRPAGEPRGRGTHTGVTEFGIVDRWGGKAIRVEFDPPGTLLHFGLHTVSQSERSYEHVYQQTAFLVHWPFAKDGRLKIRFQVRTTKS